MCEVGVFQRTWYILRHPQVRAPWAHEELAGVLFLPV